MVWSICLTFCLENGFEAMKKYYGKNMYTALPKLVHIVCRPCVFALFCMIFTMLIEKMLENKNKSQMLSNMTYNIIFVGVS